MNVKSLIEFLLTYPQDAEVKIETYTCGETHYNEFTTAWMRLNSHGDGNHTLIIDATEN